MFLSSISLGEVEEIRVALVANGHDTIIKK
jgi:hypothetical protein